MMRFISQKKTIQSEKAKFNHLKKACKLTVKRLLQLHAEHATTHCVLVIGQPESGKSILCASSAELIYSAHNETAFEIYLQQHTLFLHIPQDFFLINETRYQTLAWHFLTLQLKKQYAYLPITRCLITIDLHDFLTRSKTSNDTRLAQISLALNTLANRLRAHLDIALFFTKADLIPGFNEFFNHESKEFLEQPWGIPLEENTLSIECDQLIKKLNDRLLWRLHHELHTENLTLIKTFPLAIEAMKNKLLDILPGFLTQWDNNRFLHATQLYFVSCRQFNEITETTQAESSAIKKNNTQAHHKHFFTQQALENQCQYILKNPSAYIDKITKISFIGLCSLLLLAFILYTSQQFSQHIALIQTSKQTLEAGNIFSKQIYSSLKLNAVTQELETISQSWENLEKNQHGLLIGKYIFTRDTQLETQLQNLYQRIISQQWLPLVNQRLENYIHTHLSSDPANAYIAFTIYLMLSQPDWAVDTQYIDAHLSDLLSSSNEPIQMPIKILAGNIQKNMLVIDENSPLIQNTRDAFLALPEEKLAYVLLFSTINAHHSMNLTNALHNTPPSLEIEKKFAVIPEIYTAPLFSDIYKKRLFAIVKETLHGNKTLGAIHLEDSAENTLLPKLKEDYLQLYADTWEQAIKHIHLTPVSTLDELAIQLKTLTSIDSPILNLLNLSQTNTSMPQIEQTSAFLSEFNHTLTKQSTPENNALYRSVALLIKLRDEILSIKKDNNNSKTIACALLANENASTPENPTEAKQISLLATQLSAPIQIWMQQVVDSYYTLLNQQAGHCS